MIRPNHFTTKTFLFSIILTAWVSQATTPAILTKERILGRFATGQSQSGDADEDQVLAQNSISVPFRAEVLKGKVQATKKIRRSNLDKSIIQKEVQASKLISTNELEPTRLGQFYMGVDEEFYNENYLDAGNFLDSGEDSPVRASELRSGVASEVTGSQSKTGLLMDEQSVQMNGLNQVLQEANSNSLNQLNRLIKNRTEEAVRNQMNIANVMGEFFERNQISSAKKKNCIFFQEMMKAMPSQEKKWTKRLKDFFTSRDVVNLKSYRTLAVEMLLSFETSAVQREFINKTVDKYRRAKTVYYQEFMEDHKMDFSNEQEQVDQMRQEAEELTASLEGLFIEQQELEATFDAMRIQLKSLAGSLEAGDFSGLQQEKLAYQKMAQEVGEATEDIDFAKFAGHFSKSSTIFQFVKEFTEATEQLNKWRRMQLATAEHFLVKNSKEYGSLYGVATDAKVMQSITAKVEEFVEYLVGKTSQKKQNLLGYIKDYIASLQKAIDADKEYSAYSGLVLKAAQAKQRIGEIKAESSRMQLQIEAFRFKLQKSDFQDNLDYVFPSGLVVGLQTKKKELDNMIRGLGSDPAYLDPGDTGYIIDLQEQREFAAFFAAEDPDLKKTFQRVETQLKIAQEIDEIEGVLDFELGQAIGLAQKVTPEKNCFQLAELSYFVFTMLKTNVVVKETRFFEGFFQALPPEGVREFIVYNYMLFTNEDFVDDLLARYAKEQVGGASEAQVLEGLFTKEYVTNYSLMISFYRDMTEFGRNQEGVIGKSQSFAKNLLAMVVTLVQGKLEEIMEGKVEDLVDAVVAVIMVAIPFLTLIPFGKSILTSTLKYVIQFVVQILSVFASNVADFFNRKYAEMINKSLKEKLKEEFMFDYMKGIENLRSVGVKKKEASFDSSGSIKIIEAKYLDILNDENNVFNKLESLHVFRDDDYEKNLIEVYQKQIM